MIFLKPVMSGGLRAMPSCAKSLRGVVFDMDGTLTVPCLDFKKLRQLLGITDKNDILSHVAGLSGIRKTEAMTIIEKFEEEGRKNLRVQPGIRELFQFLDGQSSLNVGLLTRNSGEAVDHFLSKCIDLGICADSEDLFSIVKDGNSCWLFQMKYPSTVAICHLLKMVLTRDFTPVKPDPAPLLHIAKMWNTEPKRLLMVGDDRHDIECGIAAGAGTILLNNEKNQETKKLATFNIDQLTDIIPILKDYLVNEMPQDL